MADAKNKTVESIGVLAVHGIGEQKRGEFVSELCESLGEAFAAGKAAVTETIADHNPAVLCLEVVTPEKHLEINFHEVFWADLDDEPVFLSRLAFWCWGFSMWSRPAQPQSTRAGVEDQMVPFSVTRSEEQQVRGRLFLAANVVAVVALILRIVTQTILLFPVMGNWIGKGWRRFIGQSPLELLVSSLGDVKLYQDQSIRDEPFERQGEKPRVAIRRRMIREMVNVALSGYNRWYVFSHSQGTVVAFNGLMEAADQLPGYLDRRTQKILKDGKKWLSDGVVRRADLFGDLRGFLTYGSPIDKFRTLWPGVAYVNKERDVFDSTFEWINIYENVDPVAGFLDKVDLANARRQNNGRRIPLNYGYDTQRFLLTSHTNYFSKPKNPKRLPQAIAKWLLSPEQKFSAPEGGEIKGAQEKQPPQSLLYAQVAAIYVLLLILGGIFFALVWPWVSGVPNCEVALLSVCSASSEMSDSFWPAVAEWGLKVAAIAFLAVTMVGLISYGLRKITDKG